jgi:signal peptidase
MELEMTTSPPTTPQEPETAHVAPRSALGLTGRILGWLALVAAGLVVLGLLSITIGPRFLPYQALIVRSGSMSPTIPTGSIVFYRKTDASKVKVGDVIVDGRVRRFVVRQEIAIEVHLDDAAFFG